MRFCKLTRTDFGVLINELATGRSPRFPAGFGQPAFEPEPHSLIACWNDEFRTDDSLPAFIIVADQDLTDFFAWELTFLPNFRPLTAFIRVIPWSLFLKLQGSGPSSDTALHSVLIGAVLGEMMSNATGRGFIETLPLTAYETTYSYCISRALLLRFSDEVLQKASDNWKRAKNLSEPIPKLPIETLESVWSVVLRLVCDGRVRTMNIANQRLDTAERLDAIEDACRGIGSGRGVSTYQWQRLSGGFVDLSNVTSSMQSNKEHRVETFENVVTILTEKVSDPLRTSFLVGYLASLISDGSLEHAHLIFPLLEKLPTAMLWYGICAGLMQNNRIRTDYNHLGLRILRALERNDGLLSPPTCDVSLQELEVLLRGDARFSQTHASFVRVELIPLVTTVLRWSGRQSAGGGQLGLFPAEERNIFAHASRIRDLIASVRDTLTEAETLLGGNSDSRGKDYSARTKKRRGSV